MRGVEQIPWLYDLYMALIDRTGFQKWRRWVTAGATGRTLDLGCGTGRNLVLVDSHLTVVGLELDLRMARRARWRAPRVPLVVGGAEQLPFRSRCFDTVLSSLVFCSVGDPQCGLQEVARVLRPGGDLRMLEHVRSRRRWLSWLQDVLQPSWTLITGGCHPNRDTERLVERCGFEIDQSSRRARQTMRRLSARSPSESTAPEDGRFH